MDRYRRKFIKISLAITGGAVVMGSAVTLLPHRALQSLYRVLTDPSLANTSSGPLDSHSLKTLMAAVDAILNERLETGHYESYFRWYAQNVPGYKVLYDSFTANLNSLSRQYGQLSFPDSDAALKQRVLEETCQFRPSKLERLWAGLLERDRLRFDKYIILPILELFAATDAWILAGYESWPGIPRGLSKYRQAPGDAMKNPTA